MEKAYISNACCTILIMSCTYNKDMFKLVTLWVKVKSLSVKLYTPKPIFENFISIIRV